MQDKVVEDNYYVYLHRKKDDHKIFYVGKGKDKRFKSLSGRNNHWVNTSKKHGWYPIIVKDSLSEEDALDIEELIINTIGIENLCNKNYFNGGKSGFSHSIESKIKMSLRKIGKPSWNKGIKNLDSSIRMSGKNNPMYGKKIIHSKETIEKIREKNGTLVCDLHTGIFYNSITEASKILCIGRKTKKLKSRIHIFE